MILEVVLFLILLLVFYIVWNKNPSDYPPGPWLKFPFIGGGFPILNDEKCVQMQKKYGDLIMEKVGKYYWLTICDYKLGKEALCKPELSDRPELDTYKLLHEGKVQGLFTTNGDHWKTNRRFFSHYLKDIGTGKTYLEDSIKNEANKIIAEFNKLNGLQTNLKFLNFAPLNVIWQMVASKSYDVNDPMIGKLQNLTIEFFKSYIQMMMMDFIPVLKTIIPKFISDRLLNTKNTDKYFSELTKIIKPIIDDHRKNLDRGNPKDLIDLYCLEEENQQFLIKKYISDSDLRAITTDLFSAGADSTSISLRWTIFYMVKYPLLQTKMQEEIDSVVPKNTLPGLEHKAQLPYCQAVIYEILRKSSLANFSDFHTNSKDISLGGYRIPKGTIIITANHFISHDPRYWENPENFNPERFLNENGNIITPKEGFVPFGIGKRQCPGESLTRLEMFLFITAIFQNFSFSVPDIEKFDIGYQSSNMGLHMPKDQDVFVHARK